jgi:hypothetical protein
MASEPDHHCSNCRRPLSGHWCAHCGQKVLADSDRRFGHLLGQFAHELFHVNGKLPRTLGALLFKPGQLSSAYLEGQRVRYVSPIALFLIINLVYFVSPPMTDFNLDLEDQYQMQPYSSLIQPLIDQRLTSRDIEFERYARSYESANLNLARSLIVVHLPLLALALMILFPRRRMYYAEHFIIATHLFSFLLVIVLVLPQAGFWLWRIAQHWLEIDPSTIFNVIRPLMILLIVSHWLMAVRRIHTIGWLRSSLTTIALLLALVISHFCFRAVQFLVVFGVT